VDKNKIAVLFAIHIIFVIVIELLANCLNIEIAEVNEGEDFVKNYIHFLVFAVIFAPILEEVVFRYPLVKSKFLYLSFAIGLFICGTLENKILAISFGGVTIFSFTLYFFCKKDKLPNYFLAIYIVLFTLFHITNYKFEDINKLAWYSIILQFFPQLLMGIILTVVRIKTRFVYALIYHAAYNFVFALIAIFSYNLK
jgi:membrane protease YdiL (CAAX protease family)